MRGRRRDTLWALATLRQALDVTQARAAAAMGTKQPRIAELEAAALREVNPKLGTLAEYIQAIGGELEVRARFGEQSYRLDGPPQKLPPPVPIEVSPEFEAEAQAMLAEAETDER